MAAPITLQAMWLFLASAAAASLDTRSVQQEFPQLAHVIYSICGLTDIDFSTSHPCAYNMFGMAYAFTECGVEHDGEGDFKGFQNCVLGCTHNDNCQKACSDPDVTNEHCLEQCNIVATCIEKTAKAGTVKGQTSANSELKQCFAAQVPEAPPPPKPVDSTLPVLVSPAAAPAASPAASPLPAVTALLQAAPAPALAMSPAGPPVPAAPAMAPAGPPPIDFKVRKALTEDMGLVAPDCVCSKTGVIRGISTGQPGCAKHKKEANAYVEAYCYVEGGFKCGGAMASDQFPGLFWVGCEKPNFHDLYPPECEVLKRASAELFPIPSELGLKVPPANFEASRKDMPALPSDGNPLGKVVDGLNNWDEPLPPVWHEARGNYFRGDAAEASAPPPIMMAPAAAPAPVVPAAPAALLEEAASGKLRGIRQH